MALLSVPWALECMRADLRNLHFAVIFFALASTAQVAAAKSHQPFTLEQVMSAPFPTDLIASPSGRNVAWVFDDRGRRNVWVAEPGGADGQFAARRLTNYTQDDGQDIGQMTWLPDGSGLVYVRGGDLEMGGSAPNPRSFPQGVEQDVWLIRLDASAPQKIGEGRLPAVSPDSVSVAFIKDGQIWLAELNSGKPASQVIHARGDAESLRWSPDGSMLAFVNDRHDHKLIGLYSFADQSLRYLDPSVDLDSDPVWSPDGSQIAFIRIPVSARAIIFGPQRTGYPWSIRVADVKTGAGHEIWRAEPGQGSVFRAVVEKNELLWAAGNRLIFPWERDGWTHLYSVSVSGGEARLLTPGNYMVEDVALSPDRQELYLNSNENDVDRRHLWKESVDGTEPQEITSGEGIEWSPAVMADGRTVVLLHSDARVPARPAVLESGGIRDLAPQTIPKDFPADQMIVPQPVIISAADGLRIHCHIFLPKNDENGKRHPAVVFFHGGSRRQMLLGWHYMEYYNNAYAMNEYLASRGFVVLTVNYRSGIGYGMKFREALNYGPDGASEFNDVLGAGLYLRGRSDVDPKRIGVWGGSYGGYLTALALARASDLFAAGVDMHGVHDWNLEIPTWVPSYNPQRQPKAARLAFQSSPLAYMSTWRSPVLLMQGDDDRNVPFTEMIDLVKALRQQGVTFQQIVFPDEIHEFLLHSTWLRAYHAASNFLDRYLKEAGVGD